jgi:hypothetical protein
MDQTMPQPQTTPLSRDEVVEILGPLDDLKLAEIIASGASAAQLTTAKMMLAGGEPVAAAFGREEEPEVARVYEILKSEDPEPEER